MLPADQPAGLSPAGMLRWAVDALHQQAAGRPIVLAIDDAHLLDPLSAALVYSDRPVRERDGARHAAHRRAGARLPIRALWTDDLVERVELGPLTAARRPPTCCTQVLGGPVDSASADRLWRLSQGNALLLRELVIAAHASGETDRERTACGAGPAGSSWRPSLTELIDARIGQLTPQRARGGRAGRVRRADRAAAARQATDPNDVETAEERQLIRVVIDDRRTTSGWPIRSTARWCAGAARSPGPAGCRPTWPTLVEQAGTRRRDDLLRVAVWRLDSGTARDPRHAARRRPGRRSPRYDIPLATRLARAALDAGGGFDAAELLATILMFGDQPEEARRGARRRSPTRPSTSAERSRWLTVRGMVTLLGARPRVHGGGDRRRRPRS